MKTIGFFLITLQIAAAAAAEQPTGWRGNGSGIFDSKKPPVSWSADQNVVWKTPLPAPSKASPIVVGDFVFAHSYPHTLLCIQQKDGELLWQKSHGYAEVVGGAEGARLEREHPIKLLRDLYWPAGHDLSQSTPASDGNIVYSVFGTGIVSAYALDGTQKWVKFLEHSTIKHGHASSPVLAGGYLIVHLNDLVALNPQTGSEVWRTELETTHSTPVVTRLGGSEILLHPSGVLVRVSDGKILASDLFDADRASPVVYRDKIFVHGETFFHALQLLAETPSAPHQLWKTKATYGGYTIASPILQEGRIYGVNRKGIMEVVDAESGDLIYRQRLPINDKVYSGISMADGLLYIGNEKGTHLVLKAGAQYQEVSRNEIGEMINASPVFAGDKLYLRGEKHLFCIGL